MNVRTFSATVFDGSDSIGTRTHGLHRGLQIFRRLRQLGRIFLCFAVVRRRTIGINSLLTFYE